MLLDRFLRCFGSLKLAVACLGCAVVLVFVGTMAQVELGLYEVQARYFQSFFVFWNLPGTGVRIPVRPGATLTLEFSRTEAKGGIGANVITTPDGWTLALTAIQKGRQDPSRTNVWIVPLDFGGQPLEIGVKFSRPMPVEARWPRTAEWPDPLTLNPG